jgi:DNA-binding transcriptional ArsR family regulator
MAKPPIEELELLHSHICTALGDPKRLFILYALNEQPRHVTALAEYLEMPQPTVSRHLRVLKQRSLVVAERDGTAVIYRLADPTIIEILDMMRQLLRNALTRQAETMSAAWAD